MKIEYVLKEEDFVEFNLNYIKTTKNLRRNNTIQRFIGPIILMAFGAIMSLKSDLESVYWYGIFGVLSILWFMIYPRVFKGLVKKHIDTMFKSDENKKSLGEKSLEITEQGIKEIGSSSHITTWDMVEKMDNLEKHIFIYLNSGSAYIIPKRHIDKEQESKILKLCSENIRG